MNDATPSLSQLGAIGSRITCASVNKFSSAKQHLSQGRIFMESTIKCFPMSQRKTTRISDFWKIKY